MKDIRLADKGVAAFVKIENDGLRFYNYGQSVEFFFIPYDHIKDIHQSKGLIYTSIYLKSVEGKFRFIGDKESRDEFVAEVKKNIKSIKPSEKNPMIDIQFFESMPGRVSISTQKNFLKGVMEITEKEIVIFKKSYFRGKGRGEKRIRYDNIITVDFDEAKSFSMPAIQLYLSNIEYTFLSNDMRLKSFYNLIREKMDELTPSKQAESSQKIKNSSKNPMEDLKKLAELKDMGVITEEEFEAKKEELLKRI